MQRKPELLILAGLLLAAMGFVLWYVIDRRAKLHAPPPLPVMARSPAAPPAATPAADLPPAPASLPADTALPKPAPTELVDLTKHDRQTIDFSSGQPVVKNSAEDKAAIDAAMKDIESAEKETTFEAPKKDPHK